MKKIKLIIFVLLIVSFLGILYCGIFGTSLSFLSANEIKENRVLKEDLISELKINNIDTIYDKEKNIYYYMVSDKYKNKNYVLRLELGDDLKYKIIGETLNVIKVDYNKSIKVIIYNDKYYVETRIQLTNLPIINIKTEYEITTNDTNSIFNYINVTSTVKEVINNSKIHVRGATSKRFEKKSYKINMYDKNYNDEKEIRISNFYYGNSFVLDAVYRDPSKIRNVLATEIWNEISNDFSNININSEFVELFINNEYNGLYVLTEPINRRSLNLNKSSDNDTSVLIKSQLWNVVTPNINFSNITNDNFYGYEIKYPNDYELYPISWNKIFSKLSNYYDNEIDSSYEVIDSIWNIENYIDIIIFNAFINNVDNKLVKNNYIYMKSLDDEQIFMQPWDMEYSMGMIYDFSKERNILKNMEDYTEIYTQFKHRDDNVNKKLITRYWELRKHVFTMEYFNSLLDRYKNELTNGSSLRDSKKWYEYDIGKEIEEIRSWLYNRLEYFDKYVESIENE